MRFCDGRRFIPPDGEPGVRGELKGEHLVGGLGEENHKLVIKKTNFRFSEQDCGIRVRVPGAWF